MSTDDAPVVRQHVRLTGQPGHPRPRRCARVVGVGQVDVGQRHLAVLIRHLQGKEQALMFFVGMVMKKSKGKANPKIVRELLEKAIKK